MMKQMMNFKLNIHLVQIFYLKTRRWKKRKLLQKAKNIFTSLKTNPNSVLFTEERIDKRLLKKF